LEDGILGEWLIFEYDEVHDGVGRPRCPVEGCGASEAGEEHIAMVGHVYNVMPNGVGGETFMFECDHGHRWDLEPWAEDSNLVRVFIFEGAG
jgi:hypothetical protein